MMNSKSGSAPVLIRLEVRSVVDLLATQAGNSAARAVRIVAEASAVSTKTMESKRRWGSNEKALGSLQKRRRAGL